MQIKENSELLCKFYDELCSKFEFALKYGLKKAVVGYFLSGKLLVPNLQVWTLQKGKTNFITHNAFTKKNPDKLTEELLKIFEELHIFCKKHGDDWQSFTFVMHKDIEKFLYDARYNYEPVKIVDREFLLGWKGQFFYN